MRIEREDIVPNLGSSFKLLLTPRLNDYFLWHFHPEYEIVYVEGASGTRHVGGHISTYQNSDLVFIGPNIPHLNFDYGVRSACEQVIVQMKDNFLGRDILHIPEFEQIKELFRKAQYGISFHGDTKIKAGELLKQMHHSGNFDRLMILLQVFQILASSHEMEMLNAVPAASKSMEREQHRMGEVYRYIETHYNGQPNVNAIAAEVHMTTAAFCRFFKKNTKMTFTDFVNRYRINQAKNYLLQDKSVSETCYAIGLESISYFNKLFNQLAGENPTAFKRRFLSR